MPFLHDIICSRGRHGTMNVGEDYAIKLLGTITTFLQERLEACLKLTRGKEEIGVSIRWRKRMITVSRVRLHESQSCGSSLSL